MERGTVEEVVWQSDRGEQPFRLLMQAADGRVRLLSMVDDGSREYVQLMPPIGIDELMRTADIVLAGRGQRMPTTLTLTRLASAAMRLFARVRALECELAALRSGSAAVAHNLRSGSAAVAPFAEAAE